MQTKDCCSQGCRGWSRSTDEQPTRRHRQPNKIESTNNYEKFVFKTGTRPVRGRVNRLIEAMNKHNELQDYPILVSSINGHLEIADGQHRFVAAKALDLPIFYIRSRQEMSIEEIAAANALQKSWNMYDWMESWIGRGNEEYQKLKKFCETFQLPVTVGMEILGRTYSGAHSKAFRGGKFSVHNLRF